MSKVSTCIDELQLSQRFVPYVRPAEEAGFPQLARLFRTVVISETAREALFYQGMVKHGVQTDHFFVCPHCGLIFHFDHPDQCPADPTPAAEFIAPVQ